MPRLGNTPIAIDRFRFESGTFVFLLSHMHADHTDGLSRSWDLGTIYCSHTSRKLLLDKFKVDALRVVGLDLDTPHLVALDEPSLPCSSSSSLSQQPVVPPSLRFELDPVKMHHNHNHKNYNNHGNTHRPGSPAHTMTLTLVDANHCPGAVMFVLEGYFGRVLYTGDFRFTESMLVPPSPLVSRPFHKVYVDNTYCNPKGEFASREAAVASVCALVQRHPDLLFLVGVDSLGKEDLLTSIATECGVRVCVTPDRLRWLRLCGFDTDLFTTNPNQSRVHAVSRQHLTPSSLARHVDAVSLEANANTGLRGVCGLLPTGWAHKDAAANTVPAPGALVSVAYSIHSSFSELKQFCAGLEFGVLLPIVPHKYGSHLSLLRPARPFPLPPPSSSLPSSLAFGALPSTTSTAGSSPSSHHWVTGTAPPPSSVRRAMRSAHVRHSSSVVAFAKRRRRLGAQFDAGEPDRKRCRILGVVGGGEGEGEGEGADGRKSDNNDDDVVVVEKEVIVVEEACGGGGGGGGGALESSPTRAPPSPPHQRQSQHGKPGASAGAVGSSRLPPFLVAPRAAAKRDAPPMTRGQELRLYEKFRRFLDK